MPYEILEKILRFADPIRAIYLLRTFYARHGLYDQYRNLARKAGMKKLYFVLSFDCDTKEDAEVALSLNTRLNKIGVTPVYAVPGELLNRDIAVYRQILSSGAQFINHGYREHTYFDTSRNRYASNFFYDRLPLQTVRDDIVSGDRNLRETLGISPKGFRAPHFGTFQRSGQLRFLHGVLAELGYSFSTSTTPLFAYRFGPVYRGHGLFEIPVSGMGSKPLRILDSWTCFESPINRFTPQDYLAEGHLAADIFNDMGVGLLNFYADPSHVYNRPEFFDAVAYWASVARPVTYDQLLKEIE